MNGQPYVGMMLRLNLPRHGKIEPPEAIPLSLRCSFGFPRGRGPRGLLLCRDLISQTLLTVEGSGAILLQLDDYIMGLQ